MERAPGRGVSVRKRKKKNRGESDKTKDQKGNKLGLEERARSDNNQAEVEKITGKDQY